LYSEVLNSLYYALVGIFRASLKFYRLNRGEGEEARDISTFFQLTQLHTKFEKYWYSSRNAYRNSVKKYFKKFKDSLKELEIEP